MSMLGSVAQVLHEKIIEWPIIDEALEIMEHVLCLYASAIGQRPYPHLSALIRRDK